MSDPPLGPTAVRGGRLGSVVVGLTTLGLFGLVAITYIGRFDRAPAMWLTLVLFVLPYLFMAAVAWVFAVWCALPDRKMPPVLLGGVILFALGMWGPAMSWNAAESDGRPIKVMSWNVRRLWGGPEDGGDATRCVIDTIREESPDVITLMEVSRNDLNALQAALGMQCVHGTYTSGGAHKHGGLAACARNGTFVVDGDPLRFVDGEDWHYVFAEIAHEGRIFNLLAVHLTPYRMDSALQATSDRVRFQANQSAALLARVERFKDPTLVAGDFNSTRDFYLHNALRGHLTDVWEAAGFGLGATVTAMDYLPLRIDYIYASAPFGVVSTHVPDAGCSDHRPVVSHLVLP